MDTYKQVAEPNAVAKARFDRNCALIYLDFQNALAPAERRCVRRITAWAKIYFVEFYRGSPVFLSKSNYIANNENLSSDVGLKREFADPYRLQASNPKVKSRHHVDPLWDKETHDKWVEEHELEVRLFWARKKYLDLGDPEDIANVKANYELLGIEPFSNSETIRRAYHQEAKIFHPDQGGNAQNFALLEKVYRNVLDNAVKNENKLLMKQKV
ncbi:hypothetical protein PL8927_730026 [Planktothrix serta PCC 8927]|uniref:J domain-containing protein n=1 Tax=Planktothrix serta PCC 8927 TaxID=671068 RepID=A0A7Z9BZ88_9CYAN|nr:J domain-containing protein [Planktothrix serta]VXD22153.1 hypothetical protein PL8927_730026 [Planktothrix serta PCC 8927]